MTENTDKQKNQINIELPELIAEGIYSNLAVITHSTSEFVIDFIRLMPGMPKAKVQSRIILTPEHAKRFLMAFSENIANFETTNGKIKITEGSNGMIMPMNFGGPTAQA
jgi:hypothetical protein